VAKRKIPSLRLKLILEKEVVMVWSGYNCLRIRASAELLKMVNEPLGSTKGIFPVSAEQLSVPRTQVYTT
jgi:hypothetical protein